MFFVDLFSVDLAPFPLFGKPALFDEVLLNPRYDIIRRWIRLPQVVHGEADKMAVLLARGLESLRQASSTEGPRGESAFILYGARARFLNACCGCRARSDPSLLVE